MEQSIEYALRIYLGAFFSAIAVFYSLRLFFSKHKGPLTFIGTFGSAHWIGHITFRVFRILIWAVCVLRIFWESIDNYLGLITFLQISIVNIFGALLMAVGFGLALIAHKTMGDSWRLGIDPESGQKLITTGFFQHSRNPIFIGVIIGQLGFFLALPSLFTLVCLFAGVIAIANQVILEEDDLAQRFSDEYLNYKKTTPRWF